MQFFSEETDRRGQKISADWWGSGAARGIDILCITYKGPKNLSRNLNTSYNAEKSDMIILEVFNMKKVMTVCRCPHCQNLVETEKVNEFKDRECKNCGTIFRKEQKIIWKIIKKGEP